MGIEKREKLWIELEQEAFTEQKVKGFFTFCMDQSDEIVLCDVKRGHLAKKMPADFEVIKQEETDETHCTRGSLTTVYHIKIDDKVREKFEKLSSIYGPVYMDARGNKGFVDPAFYKDDELVCSICSHEGLGRLFLDEKQYNSFHALRIPHDVRNLDKQCSFEERLEEYAYQERTVISFMDVSLKAIPDTIGKVTTLKKVELFCHQLDTLPVALEKLVNLTCLRLTGNKVEDLGFDISKLAKLKVLDLGGMPLKVFPEGITQLSELEELYITDLKNKKIPETLMNLKKLKKLMLPELDTSVYSDAFITFVEERRPKKDGTSLSEILGEEWARMVESGNCIIINGTM